MALASKKAIETFGSIKNEPSLWLLQTLKSDATDLKQKSELIVLLPAVAAPGTCEGVWCKELLRDALEAYSKMFPHSFLELLHHKKRLEEMKVALSAVLTAARDSGNADVLQCVIQITAGDEVHVFENDIKKAVEEMCGHGDHATYQTELAKHLWKIVSDKGMYPILRVTILDRFLVPILRRSSGGIVLDFFSLILKDIVDILNLPFSKNKNTDYQLAVQYADYILAFTLAENLFPNIDSSLHDQSYKMSTALEQTGLQGNKLLALFCRKSLAARGEDHNIGNEFDKISGKLYRLYQCRAYRCLASALASRQSDDLQHYLTMLQTRNSSVRPWDLIVDPVHVYSFPLSDIEISKHCSLVVAMKTRKSSGLHDKLDMQLTAQSHGFSRKDLFLQTLSDNVLSYDLTASYVRDQVKPSQTNYTQLTYESSSLNDHECMGTLCGTIRLLAARFSAYANDWLLPIIGAMVDSQSHVNIRLFLAQAIYNEKDILSQFAEVLFEPFMVLIADLYKEQSLLDSMHVKLIVLLLSWRDRVLPSNTKQKMLASSLFEVLLKNLDPNMQSKSVHKHTVSLLEALVSTWHESLAVPYDVLNAKLASGGTSRTVALRVTAILLVNGLPPSDQIVNFFKDIIQSVKVADSNQDAYCEVVGLTLTCLQRGLSDERDTATADNRKCVFDDSLKETRSIIMSLYEKDNAAFIKCLYYVQKSFPDILNSELLNKVISLAIKFARGASKCILIIASGLKILLDANDTAYSRLDHLDLSKMLQNSESRVATLRLMEELAKIGESSSLKPFFKDLFECSRSGPHQVREAAIKVFMAIYDAVSNESESSSRAISSHDRDQFLSWCTGTLVCSAAVPDRNECEKMALDFISSRLPNHMPDKFCKAVQVVLGSSLPDNMALIPTDFNLSSESILGTLAVIVLDACKKAPDYESCRYRERPLKEVDFSENRTDTFNTFTVSTIATLSSLVSKNMAGISAPYSNRSAKSRLQDNEEVRKSSKHKSEKKMYPKAGPYPDVEINVKDLLEQILMFAESDPECSIVLFVSLLKAVAEQQESGSIAFYTRAGQCMMSAILKNDSLSQNALSGILQALLVCVTGCKDQSPLTEILSDSKVFAQRIVDIGLRNNLETLVILLLEELVIANGYKRTSQYEVEPRSKKPRIEKSLVCIETIDKMYSSFEVTINGFDEGIPSFSKLSSWDEFVEKSEPITIGMANEFLKWLPQALDQAAEARISERKGYLDKWIERANHSRWIITHPLTKWPLLSWQLVNMPIAQYPSTIHLLSGSDSYLSSPGMGELKDFVSSMKDLEANGNVSQVVSLAMMWERAVPYQISSPIEHSLWSARLALRQQYVKRLIAEISKKEMSQDSETKYALEIGQRNSELHLARVSNTIGCWELASDIIQRNYGDLSESESILDWGLVSITSKYYEALSSQTEHMRLQCLMEVWNNSEKFRDMDGKFSSKAEHRTLAAAVAASIIKNGGTNLHVPQPSGSLADSMNSPDVFNWPEQGLANLTEAAALRSENHCTEVGRAYLNVAEFCWNFTEEQNKAFRHAVVNGVLRAIIHGNTKAQHSFSKLLLLIEKSEDEELTDQFMNLIVEIPARILQTYLRQLLSSCLRFPRIIDVISEVANNCKSSTRMWCYTKCSWKFCNLMESNTHIVQRLDAAFQPSNEETKLNAALRWICCPVTVLMQHMVTLANSIKQKDKWVPAYEAFHRDVHSSDQSGLATSLRGRAFNILQEFYPQVSRIAEWSGEAEFEEQATELLTNIYNQLKQRRDQSVAYTLEDLSPFLANYSSAASGQVATFDDEPLTIIGFDSKIKIMTSLRRPVLLTITASDGSKKRWLVKHGDDLGQDRGALELLELMDWTLKQKTAEIIEQHDLHIKDFHIMTYKVIPLGRDLGLVQWVDNCSTLREVALSTDPAIRDICGDIFLRRKEQNTIRLVANVQNSLIQFQNDRDRMPLYMIRNSMINISNTAEGFFKMRETFTKYLAAISVAHWILGIGDRHLSNILIQDSGALCGVDYALVFCDGTRTSAVPELMPFRLTPKMEAVFNPRGIQTLSLYMCQVLKVLGNFRSLVCAEVEMLLRDLDVPINMPASAKSEDTSLKCGCSGVRNSSYRDKLKSCDLKLSGEYHPTAILCGDLRSRVWCAKHEPRLHAYIRTVRSASPFVDQAGYNHACTVKEQISAILEAATSETLQSLCFYGWEPWI